MNINKKIIITDTNIITDLYNANVLEKFISLDNVFVVSIVKNDEFNEKTCNINIINKMKTIECNSNDIKEVLELKKINRKLSTYDLLNYLIAKKYNGLLATGDNKLKKFAEVNNVEVIRTLKIIEMLYLKKIVSKDDLIESCNLLINNINTRIPISEIYLFMKKITKD